MLKNSGIYVIRNTVSDDIYVGSSCNLRKRYEDHRIRLRGNCSHSPILQNSWNKYGESAFVFDIIEHSVRPENLIEREQYWINTLHPQLNAKHLATSSLGCKQSEATKAKIRTARLRQACPRTGKKHSEETKQKMRAVRLGKPHPHTAEWNARIGLAQPKTKPRRNKFALCAKEE